MSAVRYVAVLMDGSLLHGGREYVPRANDAAGWDAYRLRHGVAS